jgi:hypothetical protein
MVGVVGVVGGFQTDGDQHDNRLPNDGPWCVGTCGKRKQKSVVGWLCEVERIVSAAIIPHQKNTTAAASLAVSSQYHHWQHHCGSGWLYLTVEGTLRVRGRHHHFVDRPVRHRAHRPARMVQGRVGGGI